MELVNTQGRRRRWQWIRCVMNGRSDFAYHADLGATLLGSKGKEADQKRHGDLQYREICKRWACNLGTRPPLLPDTEKCGERQFTTNRTDDE